MPPEPRGAAGYEVEAAVTVGAMGTFGEMFPGRKLGKDGGQDGTGERVDRGPLDLDSGVVRLGRPAEQRARDDEEDTDQDG
jgi:hypothetical protein